MRRGRCNGRRRGCGPRRGRRRSRLGRRCGDRRRRARRWRSLLLRLLGWLFGLSVGTKLLLGLRHNQRRSLRVRWGSGQLQRRESCRGKQQESKFCHDDWGPRKILGNKVWQQGLSTNSGDQQTSVRPDCGVLQTGTGIYFRRREVRMRVCSLRIQTIISNCRFAFSPSQRAQPGA